MTKVTMKENFDSIWAKATFEDKKHVKLFIGRSGITLKGNCTKEIFSKFSAGFNSVYKEWKKLNLDYGVLVKNTVENWKEIT